MKVMLYHFEMVTRDLHQPQIIILVTQGLNMLFFMGQYTNGQVIQKKQQQHFFTYSGIN